MRILTEVQEQILKGERDLLNQLQVMLTQFSASEADLRTLRQSLSQLDDLFLLVVVGEFNAGKSAFINALLGEKLLKEGVTPTTTQINLLRYGEDQEELISNGHQHTIRLPVKWLAEISIVDTPGTNAIMREHEAITAEFVPRSDLVLFVTSVDRPFTESERQFLERIRDWGKKVVIIINKIDILQSAEDLEQVRAFVAENARQLLGTTPEIFAISTRLALCAKQGEPNLWQESQFESLETYIRDTLDEKSRLQLKFLNPLGVGLHLVGSYLDVAQERLGLLKADFDMLADVEAQLKLYKEDMDRDFEFRMSDIEKILYEMETRGEGYFDETFRLARVADLLSKERIRQEFEQQVVGEAPQRIEQRVNELVDWLVDCDMRQWQAVSEHLAERRRRHEDRIVGEMSLGTFNYDRDRIMEAVGREAQRVVETYDRSTEAQAIAQGAQEAVAASAVLEVGAVSLGTIVAMLATTVAADVTGVLLASMIALLGLFIIPARRRIAKTEMREKVGALRTQLVNSLHGHFEKEIQRSLYRINEAIAPYTRFVRSERNTLTELQANLAEIQTGLQNLKLKIESF